MELFSETAVAFHLEGGMVITLTIAVMALSVAARGVYSIVQGSWDKLFLIVPFLTLFASAVVCLAGVLAFFWHVANGQPLETMAALGLIAAGGSTLLLTEKIWAG